MRVPFGAFIGQRWWFKLWATLGVRNKSQNSRISADQAADQNIMLVNSALHYISCSSYKVIWRTLGFEYRFVDQEFFDCHWRAKVRALGRLNRAFPILGWVKRTFKVRHVLLTKK
jgi:hypothetical protein